MSIRTIKPIQERKVFKRPCRRCDETYQPSGRFQKYCTDCSRRSLRAFWDTRRGEKLKRQMDK